jgi:DNA-directed RNA polymerase specialized sigma24 family protein
VLGGTAGDGWGRAAAYDAYADGLHTYTLWYLRDHDAAADAVYCAFVAADRNHTNLQQPEQIQPWLYALLRRECRLRAAEPDSPKPVSLRLRPKADALGESGVAESLLQLEGNLRRAEFHSLAWPEAEGLAPSHREVLELTIRHGLDSRGLALVLGLREGAAGLAPSRGFGLLADAWRELERSLAAAAVAASGRDNCAQLAELTFGWSGKLNANLRAPLTDHVDRCSRCQHYLHTVIGTPSAPTILPFVAAPRALRDILLGELSDLDAAADAGVDVLALGARCGSFGADGFPSRLDPASQGTSNAPAGAGRGPRRRVPRTRQIPAQARPAAGTGTAASGSGAAAAKQAPVKQGPDQQQGLVGQAPVVRMTQASATSAPLPAAASPGAPASPASPVSPVAFAGGGAAGKNVPVPDSRRRPVAPKPVAPKSVAPKPAADGDELFRARGSWADRVLPPQAAGWAGERGSAGAGELWRPEPDSGFVQTPSGRFAVRPPEQEREQEQERERSAAAAASAPASPANSTPANSRLPRYARPGARPAGSARPSAAGAAPGGRRRHKARPMRQAVVSAMALGAIGAVAAAAAAMLGAVSHQHANTALDGAQGGEPLGSATGTASAAASADGLSVAVTGSQTGAGLLSGSTGLGVGLVPTGLADSAATASTSASSGAFYVSVNQRAADPDSVQILLRNAGTGPLRWSAAPTESWLSLSQSSGTLAAGQSVQITATAGASAPSGQWSGQIVFSPGGIVVTVHGGTPTGSGSAVPTTPTGGTGTGTGTGTPSPTSGSPTPTGGGTTASPTSTATATAGASTPVGTATGTAAGTGTATGTQQGSTTPSAAPTTPSRPARHR